MDRTFLVHKPWGTPFDPSLVTTLPSPAAPPLRGDRGNTGGVTKLASADLFGYCSVRDSSWTSPDSLRPYLTFSDPHGPFIDSPEPFWQNRGAEFGGWGGGDSGGIPCILLPSTFRQKRWCTAPTLKLAVRFRSIIANLHQMDRLDFLLENLNKMYTLSSRSRAISQN